MTNKKRRSRKNISRGSEPPNHLGQLVMHNKKLLYEIVNLAQVDATDTVLEFGAGKGAVTEILSQ